MHGGGDRVASPPGVPPRPRPPPVVPCHPPWRLTRRSSYVLKRTNAPGVGRVLLRRHGINRNPDLYRHADGAHRPRRPPPPGDRAGAPTPRRLGRTRTASRWCRCARPARTVWSRPPARPRTATSSSRSAATGRRSPPSAWPRRPAGPCSASPAAAWAPSPPTSADALPETPRPRARRRLARAPAPALEVQARAIAPGAQRPRDRPPRRRAGLRLGLGRRPALRPLRRRRRGRRDAARLERVHARRRRADPRARHRRHGRSPRSRRTAAAARRS